MFAPVALLASIVDERNPEPPGMFKPLLNSRGIYEVVQEFFHQQ